jgi:hypothetical protein
VVATFVVCIFIERSAMNYSLQEETQMAPSRAAMGDKFSELPPEPRLQGVSGHQNDPQKDLRDMRKEAQEANESYQWVDKTSGIAQIPVSEAMKIIAEKGLAGAAPAPAEQRKVAAKKPDAEKAKPKKAAQKK